jgi:hypothetical protein
MDGDARHRRLTGSFLAVAQHLTQERPDSNHGRIDRVLAEQVAMPDERLLDPLSDSTPAKGRPG